MAFVDVAYLTFPCPCHMCALCIYYCMYSDIYVYTCMDLGLKYLIPF